MTRDQVAIAQALLNSYAHQLYDLTQGDVIVAGMEKDGVWHLGVVCTKTDSKVLCGTFDEAKAIIDSLIKPPRRLI